MDNSEVIDLKPAVMKVIAPLNVPWNFKTPEGFKLTGVRLHLMEGIEPIAFLEFEDKVVPLERIEGEQENGRA